MTIVSVSLNKKMLAEMDKMQKSYGFSGRSEIVRAGIHALLSQERQRNNNIITGGFIYALFLAMHDEESDEQVTEMRHIYDKLVLTHLHSKIEDRCLEIFLLNGNVDDIRHMAKQFQDNKKMYNVKLIIT